MNTKQQNEFNPFQSLFTFRFWTLVFVSSIFVSQPIFASGLKSWKWSGLAQYSSEWDDNVRRVAPQQGIEKDSDGVHRLFLQAKLELKFPKNFLFFQYNLGMKHFYFLLGEDTLINQGAIDYYLSLPKRLFFQLHFFGKDKRRWVQTREFSSLLGRGSLLWFLPHQWKFNFSGGVHWYQYRDKQSEEIHRIPDSQRYSHWGDLYSFSVQKTFLRKIKLHLNYQLSRSFYTFRYALEETPSFVQIIGQLYQREDWFHQPSLEISLLFKIYVMFRYTLEAMQSDSYGESFLGHRLFFKLAWKPFWNILWVVQGNLNFRKYSEKNSLSSLWQIGELDENFSSVTIRLSRPIWGSLSYFVRYSYFTNRFSTDLLVYERNILSAGFQIKFR